MPADAQPVVTSAFGDTLMDVRGRVRQIIATRAIADTRLDQRLAASVSRIEGVDQAGLAVLASEGLIVEQNVAYHLPNGGAFVVSVDALGHRRAMDEALERPSLVCRKIEKRRYIARRDGDQTVAWQSKPRVIVDDEMVDTDGHQRATLHCKVRRWRPSSPIREIPLAPSLEMAIGCAH